MQVLDKMRNAARYSPLPSYDYVSEEKSYHKFQSNLPSMCFPSKETWWSILHWVLIILISFGLWTYDNIVTKIMAFSFDFIFFCGILLRKTPTYVTLVLIDFIKHMARQMTNYEYSEVNSIPSNTIEATSPVAAAQEQIESISGQTVDERSSSANHSTPASEL